MKKHTGVFAKYIMLFIISSFVPLLITEVILFHSYEESTREQTLNSVSYMFDYIAANMQQVAQDFDEIIRSANNVGNDTLTPLLIQKRIGNATEADIEKKNAVARELINDTIEAEPYVKGAVFIEPDYSAIGQSRTTGILKTDYNYSYFATARQLFEDNEDVTFLPTHTARYYNDFTKIITFVKTFTYTPADGEKPEILGALFVDVYVDALGVFFENADKEMMSILYLADESGVCLYSINESWIGRKIYEFDAHKNNTYSQMGGKMLYFSSRKIQHSNWTLVCGVEETYVLGRINAMKRLAVSLTLAALLLCLVIAFAASSRFTKPIRHILDKMKAAREGDLSARVQLKRADELGQIGEGFNDMLKRLEENIQKVYVSQIKQKDAELSALKTQIQPHFLYNTLEVIRLCAAKNKDFEVAEMVTALADQFRYLIEGGSDCVSVDEETQIIKKYFKLIDIRFGGKITMQISISREAGRMEIPRLTLQMIVENAIGHGVKAQGGKVRVSGTVTEGVCTLEVRDNGVGMSRERLFEVNRALTDSTASIEPKGVTTGIGLKNINERLSLRYGDAYRMKVTSIEGIGTCVKITIDLRE